VLLSWDDVACLGPRQSTSRSTARYIDPRELKRWRKSDSAFSALPQETRDALGAHGDAQLRLTRLFDHEASRCSSAPTHAAQRG
jgi:hypothetical protein